MALEVLRQANFVTGALDPRCHSRRDLRAYTSALAIGVNLLPRAQGPVSRRPGLAHIDLVRNRLEAVERPVATAPNGGDGAALGGDGMTTTTPVGASSPYVIASFDFGAPASIGLVDVVDFVFGGGDGWSPGPAPPQLPWWRSDSMDEV